MFPDRSFLKIPNLFVVLSGALAKFGFFIMTPPLSMTLIFSILDSSIGSISILAISGVVSGFGLKLEVINGVSGEDPEILRPAIIGVAVTK